MKYVLKFNNREDGVVCLRVAEEAMLGMLPPAPDADKPFYWQRGHILGSYFKSKNNIVSVVAFKENS